jgi:hypothetical protein
MYNIVDIVDNDTDNNVTTMTITQTLAAATTENRLGKTHSMPSAHTHNLGTAINLIAANQQALYHHISPISQHIAVISFHAQQPCQARPNMFQAWKRFLQHGSRQ